MSADPATSETPTRPGERVEVPIVEVHPQRFDEYGSYCDWDGETWPCEAVRTHKASAGGGDVPDRPAPPALGADGRTWGRLKAAACVECPDCAFVMGEEHTDEDTDFYSCPNCAQAAAGAVAVPPPDATMRDLLERVHTVLQTETPHHGLAHEVDEARRAVAVPEDRPGQITDEMVERAEQAARTALAGITFADDSAITIAVRAALRAALGDPTALSPSGVPTAGEVATHVTNGGLIATRRADGEWEPSPDLTDLIAREVVWWDDTSIPQTGLRLVAAPSGVSEPEAKEGQR